MSYPYNAIPTNNPQNITLASPVGIQTQLRNPTPQDDTFPIGTLWENTITRQIFICVSATIAGAVWSPLTSGGGGNVLTLQGNTGSVVPPDGSGNIHVVGDGTTITIVGNPGTNTLTASLIGGGSAIEKINVQTGTSPVVPSSGAISFNGATVVAGSNPVRTDGTSANTMALEVQLSQAIAGTDATKVGLAAFNSADFTVDANGFVSSSATGILNTLSDDVNTSVTPSAGNIQLVGHINEQGATKFSTVVAGSHLLNLNPMSSARWIVDPLGFNGTHTTIASAITSATSGDTIFLLPGTYTENLTLKTGVNLASYDGTPLNQNVIISGTLSYSSAGAVAIEGITLQTNSAAFLSITGSAASTIYIRNCYLNATNATGITYSTSSSGANISIEYSTMNVGTTGIGLFSHSSAGALNFNYCIGNNSGGTSTTSTCSSGSLNFNWCDINFPVSTSGTTAILTTQDSGFNTIAQNAISITHNSTSGGSQLISCGVSSGTASCISIGAGAILDVIGTVINSSNANTITGSGHLRYSFITFQGSSSGHNVTTETAFATLI